MREKFEEDVQNTNEDLNKDLEKNEDKKKKNGDSLTIMDWVKSLALALALALFIRSFVANATTVSGTSMNNTLQNRDVLLVNKMFFRIRDVKKKDIVIIKAPDIGPNEAEKDYIKRVIALPGETVDIKNGRVYVDGQLIKEAYINTDYTTSYEQIGNHWSLQDDEIFVMGDNRIPGKSSDSRVFGPVKLESIKGVAIFRLWPFNSFGTIN